MASYVDTGVLVKLYCRERDSDRAAEVLGACRPPMLVCAWQLLEIRNAMRLKVFRDEISHGQFVEASAYIDADMDAGILTPVALDLEGTLSLAARLSEEWTARLGCRTLDIIHVAAAQLLKADELVTFDQRQGELGKRAGLQVRGV